MTICMEVWFAVSIDRASLPCYDDRESTLDQFYDFMASATAEIEMLVHALHVEFLLVNPPFDATVYAIHGSSGTVRTHSKFSKDTMQTHECIRLTRRAFDRFSCPGGPTRETSAKK